MEKRDLKTRRRSGVVLAGLLGLVSIGSTINAPTANAIADVKTDRVAGTDRYDTAAKMATGAFTTATNVVVASGRNFADALAGAALAGAKGGPLLLTDPNALPAATDAALTTLKPTTVYLLGGTAAVSQAVQDTLAAKYAVKRLSGADRYATAAAIGAEIGPAGVALLGTPAKRTAFIATGLDFADALAGGPLAAAGAGTIGVHPVLLVNNDVPKATSDALSSMGIQQVVILGGTGAVSGTVEAKLETATGNDSVRYAGINRFDTAAKVAAAGIKDYGFDGTKFLLANGTVFADALAGGPFGSAKGSPIVLTEAAKLPDATVAYLQSQSAKAANITALGGTVAVSDTALAQAEKAAEAAVARQNEDFTVLPADGEVVANSGSRSYTVSGLGTTAVNIVLVNCERIKRSAGGDTTFTNSNNNGIADGTRRINNTATPGADDADLDFKARITTVNGSPSTSAVNGRGVHVVGAAPVNGVVSFDVGGPGPQDTTTTLSVCPVVFADRNGDTALNGSALDQLVPNEPFATGGRTTFTANPAAAGQFYVDTRRVSGASFNGCALLGSPPDPSSATELTNEAACSFFAYDDGDQFQVKGTTVTPALFRALLSVGDDIIGTYDPTEQGISTLNLTDDTGAPPPAPGVTASATATVAVGKVTWTASASTPGEQVVYNVYRGSSSQTGDCATASYTRVSPANGVNDTKYDDSSALTAGYYCYRVSTVVTRNQASNQPSNNNGEGPPSAATKVQLT